MTCDFAQFSGKLYDLTLQLHKSEFFLIIKCCITFQFNNNLIGGTLKRMKSSYS